MLGPSLHEVRGLIDDIMKKLCGENWEKFLAELKHCAREEPAWDDEMMFIPIEWGPDFGSVSCDKDAADAISRSNMSDWRVPTITELRRGLENPSNGFREGVFYYSSTPAIIRGDHLGNEVLKTNCGHVCGSESSFLHESCHLRLCRVKIM